MPWNPDQYNKFQAERSAPFFDLLELLTPRPNLKAVDLGCGTGELTRQLADRIPDAEVLGLDQSAQMLSKSAAFARDGLRFEQGNIRDVQGRWDVIFSNAALQWLDDHHQLFSRLWGQLELGGQLLVQMPANHNHISHKLAAELAETAFPEYFPEGGRKSPVLPVEEYAQMFFDLGGENITAVLKVYPHVLEDSNAVVEWVKGTLLTSYLEQLPTEVQADFLSRYRQRLAAELPQKPFFYGFKRVLLTAQKAR